MKFQEDTITQLENDIGFQNSSITCSEDDTRFQEATINNLEHDIGFHNSHGSITCS